jgi:hypothetical protein
MKSQMPGFAGLDVGQLLKMVPNLEDFGKCFSVSRIPDSAYLPWPFVNFQIHNFKKKLLDGIQT